MDSLFALRRKYRLITRSSRRARSSLLINSVGILSFVIASISTYADDNHGRPCWDRDRDQHWLGTTLSSFFLTNIEVKRSNNRGAIVTLGDSITDGTASTPDSNHRWPNFLADRLQASHHDQDLGVLDQGISGIPGITDQAVSADDIIAGLTQIIERAHARGLRICGCMLTPFEVTFPGYYTPEGEVKRATVNEWIRTSDAYDAVIDFDKAAGQVVCPCRGSHNTSLNGLPSHSGLVVCAVLSFVKYRRRTRLNLDIEGVRLRLLANILRVDTDFRVKGVWNSYKQKNGQRFSMPGSGAVFLDKVKSFRDLLQLFSKQRAGVVQLGTGLRNLRRLIGRLFLFFDCSEKFVCLLNEMNRASE
jgi:hypothetical protein